MNIYGTQSNIREIPIQSAIDLLRQLGVIRISNNEEYRLNLVNPNQCATVVQRSLNKTGVETRVNRTITNCSTGGDFYQIEFNPYLPSQAFKSIMYNNPHGQYIKRLK